MKHEFFIMKPDSSISIYDINALNKIEVEDNLILYMISSFEWLDTYWNESQDRQHGLNYYGYTIFKKDSIQKLEKIFCGWKCLFENATETFVLLGDYLVDENEFEENIYIKQQVLDKLEELINLCKEAIFKSQNIVHIGL